MKEQELTFTDEEYEWMKEDRNAFISLFRFMTKVAREGCEKRVLAPYVEMQEKDFKMFWSTIDNYAKENCLFLDAFALPFCERTAKMLSKKYGINVYKSDDGQNMYCIPILDRIFEAELLENDE